MKVLVVGEVNADLIFSGFDSLPQPGREILTHDFSMELGGSSAICAAGLARLGVEVSLFSKVGTDVFGQFCVEKLKQAGVDISHMRVNPELKTGITASFSSTDRALATYPGAIAALRADEISPSILCGFTHLHVSSYYLQSGLRRDLPLLFRTARQMGLTVSLDPGYDPAQQWSASIFDVLTHCDLFLLNEVELAALSGTDDLETGLRTLQHGPKIVIAKLGKRGCAAWSEGQLFHAGPIDVNAIDTTGAGDSFDAGFLCAWLRHFPLEVCLASATICGGLSTRALGGCGGQASWSEVERIMQQTAGYATIHGKT